MLLLIGFFGIILKLHGKNEKFEQGFILTDKKK